MSEHEFILLIEGDLEAKLDELFQAGCDDAAFGVVAGVGEGEFIREAPTLADAILSAIQAVESTGLTVVKVAPENLVTINDIAKRWKVTRQYTHKYIKQHEEDFPAPVYNGRSALWDWAEVVVWKDGDASLSERAALISGINGILAMRSAPLQKDERARVLQLAG